LDIGKATINICKYQDQVSMIYDFILFILISFQIAKMAKYCNRQTACEILFGWFILIWIITRVGIYPYWFVKKSITSVFSLL